MTIHSNFWPLDFDQEMEIFDSPSWNLPGRSKKPRKKEAGARKDGRVSVRGPKS